MDIVTDISDLAFDRDKVLSWWTGRISNADLAAWTDQTERDVRLILNTPYMKREIIGGGRGSKSKRRISEKARNSVAIIASLRKAGMSIEASAALLNAAPILASWPTDTIDFSPSTFEAPFANYSDMATLSTELPDEGWLPIDNVPRHVFSQHCRPIVKDTVAKPFSIGDVSWLADWKEAALGGLPEGWRSLGDPIYRPEIDPFGVFEFENSQPDTSDTMDSHFYIVDGRWVFSRQHDPDPRTYMVDVFRWAELGLDRRFPPGSVEFSFDPIVEMDPSNRSGHWLRGDEEKEQLAQRSWSEPETKLDINATLAVRRMKRAALGLNNLSRKTDGADNG